MRSSRVKPKYTQIVNIPEQFKRYFWDCPDGRTHLEKLILRVLEYGNFEEIKQIYMMYPKQAYDVVLRYSFIRRGVRFWIKLWSEQNF